VIENVNGGALGDTLIGNSLDNILIGGAGSDALEGKDGDDDLDGGTGSDIYFFKADLPLGHDGLFEPANADTDLIDFTGTTVGVNLNLDLNTSQT
jgi:Ca2+-binding RTX toxin-like protein